MRLRILSRTSLALAACVSLCGSPAMGQTVGKAAAVNPASTSVQPGRGGRVLNLGNDVIFRERISTSAAGSVQVLFADKTTLNVGPGSDIVIDEFVYDPGSGAGRMAATLSRGVLRFVRGNISHSGGATVRTPVAVLGIRGGVFTARHNAQGTRAVLHFGRLTVTTAAGTSVVTRPGFVVAIAPSGALVSPTRVAQAEVDQILGQTLSRPGQRGGARRLPSDRIALAHNVGEANDGVDRCTPSLQRQNLADAISLGCRNPSPGILRQVEEINRDAQQLATDRIARPITVTPQVPQLPPTLTPAPPVGQ
jgi:hypothetical protein